MTEEKPTVQAIPGEDQESQVKLELPDEDEDDHEVVQANAKADKKAKLNDYLSLFGFHDVVVERHYRGMSDDVRGDVKGGPVGKTRKKKSQHQTVVYGDVDSDDDNDYNQDYGQQNIPDDTDADDDGAEEVDEGEEAEQEEDDEAQEDDEEGMWEDDEAIEIFDEEALEELEEAREYAAELERERIRELRMWEIMRVKEILLERYLKTARIMITLRKKNIYLQDYLYHLAFRKGVLRGDPSAHGHHAAGLGDDGDDGSVTGSQLNLVKLQKQRLQKKNSLMAARFARFLRKTGHLFDEEQAEDKAQQRHHHPHTIVHKHGSSHPKKSGHNIHHRGQHYGKGKRSMDANACPDGKDCDKGKRKKASVMSTGNRYHKKRQSVRDIIEKRAKTHSVKAADEALTAFEHHRCKMKMQKKLLERAELLQHHKEIELPVLDQERAHLVHFVEQSVTAQNLAKRRALRRQKKNLNNSGAGSNKKTGPTNVNHQWIKSLERIRELRLKKAKLEQDHRLVLIEKVHQWDTWEKRDLAALESVAEFILEMVSRTTLSKRESESFNAGMEQFRKQLYTLFEAMLWQVTRLFKAKCMLQMAQRKLKDKASVATESVKGFSLGDFERMAIENREGHQKLAERKVHLVKQSQKLQRYISKVAAGNTDQKIIWGALHAGRHDLRQLWQLCLIERDNLLKKWKEALRSKRVHRRMFMQVAVVENHRVFTDYLRVRNRVRELEEKRGILNTRYRQNTAVLRVLKIRTNEIRNTITGCRQGKMDQISNDEQKFFKDTIEYRLNPRPPNTVYSVNTRRNSSLHRILEPEIDQKIFKPIRSLYSRENKTK